MSDHLGGAHEIDANTYMVDVFGYLLVKYELRSVLDIGAGYGNTLKWFADNGLCNVMGVEGMQEYIDKSVVPGALIQHDYTLGKSPLCQPFDLAWSAEFLEHVEEQYIPNFMKDFQLCRYACVTHAEPGQGGHHHVNCKSSDYWIRKFAEFGFYHNAEESALLRRTDRWRAMWGRRTLLSFQRC